MSFTLDQLERACGFLFQLESKAFVYCCKQCPNEFTTGAELETHILFVHDDDESTFDNDSANDLVYTDIIELGDYIKSEPTQQSEEGVIRIDLPETIKDQRKTVNSIKNTSKISPCQSLNSLELARKHMIGQTVPTNQMAISVVHEPVQKSSNSFDNSTVHRATTEVRAKFDPKVNGNDSKCQRKRLHPKATDQKQNYDKPHRPIFYCDKFPRVNFSTIEILKMHIKQHAVNGLRKPCPLSPIQTRNFDKRMENSHAMVKAKPHKCEYCDETFMTYAKLITHMRTHLGDRPFLCATCGKGFKFPKTRKYHNMRMHGEKMPHSCNECGRGFVTPSWLQDHIYSCHSTLRPYKCEICGNNYATRKYLRRHRHSHGDKIHKCKFCEKKFKTTETRRWHERHVHQKSTCVAEPSTME